MSKVALPKWCSIVRTQPAIYERDVFTADVLVSPHHVANLVRPHLERLEVENFLAISLDAQHRPIGVTKVTSGILNSSLVHPRETYRVAVAMGAAAIIVAHNHPSGDPTPSVDDRAVTDQLVAAGKILDIPCFDHIIIAGDRHVSFAEAGFL